MQESLRHLRVRALIGVLAIGVALAGCTGSPEPTGPSPGVTTTAATPPDSETQAPDDAAPSEDVDTSEPASSDGTALSDGTAPSNGTVPQDFGAVGSKVSEVQAAGLPQGQLAYLLTSGDRVIVDRLEPLPDSVLDDLALRALDAVPEPDEDFAHSSPDFPGKFVAEVQKETGKYLALTYPAYAFPGCTLESDPGLFWVTNIDKGTFCPVFKTEAKAVEALEEYIQTAMGGAEAWVILSTDRT